MSAALACAHAPLIRSIEDRNALVEGNVGLVVMTRQRFFPRAPRAMCEDLFQAGLVGLIRAAERFDPALGCKFGTYAVPWIRNYIGRALRSDSLIRISESLGGEEREQARQRLQPVPLRDGVLAGLEARPEGVMDEVLLGEQQRLAFDVLGLLPDRQAAVLRGRFFDERSLVSLSIELGVSKERVRQIEKAALKRCRRLLGVEG
jgi:RNA polymerase sigma factor (sigma-70 family)